MKERAGDWLRRVIQPALAYMGPAYSGASIERGLLVTGWHESAKFSEIAQLGPDYALGPWQMERLTFDDLWERWLDSTVERRGLRETLRDLVPPMHADEPFEALACAPLFACGMARLRYRMVPQALPAAGDAAGWAAYWKQHYNTPLGAGKPAQFMEAWNEVFG